jgi:hypothetical protein
MRLTGYLKNTMNQKGSRINQETMWLQPLASVLAPLRRGKAKAFTTRSAKQLLQQTGRTSFGKIITPPTNSNFRVRYHGTVIFLLQQKSRREDKFSFPILQKTVVMCHLERKPAN